MNRSKAGPATIMLGVLFALASAAGLIAQTYQGALRGAVRDAQGVIPGAEVILTNEDTNAERSAMTNEVGEYAFGSVLPGTYSVRVSLPGFKTDERKGFRIGTQQSLVFDFLLEVGTLSEQITVTGRDDARQEVIGKDAFRARFVPVHGEGDALGQERRVRFGLVLTEPGERGREQVLDERAALRPRLSGAVEHLVVRAIEPVAGEELTGRRGRRCRAAIHRSGLG